MKRCIRMFIFTAAVIFACSHAKSFADVKLHRLFTENMIVQRDRPIPVWGWANPGEKISVSFGDQKESTTADKDGNWMIKLDPMAARSIGADLVIRGNNEVILKNVLVGDVWLCSGQSNMEWGLGGCNAQKDIDSADYPGIRFLRVPMICSEKPNQDIETKEPWCRWNVCSPGTAGGASAVGFYFGRKIHRETGVPIGLLVSSVGGTNIEKWMSNESISEEPSLVDMAHTIDQSLAEYRKELSDRLDSIESWTQDTRLALKANRGLPVMPDIPRHPFLPGSRAGGNWVHLYNGMISPLVHFPIRGAIWYQGESNGGEGDEYCDKMRAMIGAWRKAWKQGDFPFYFVQLANFERPNDDPAGGDGWARVRMAQLKSLQISNTGMAVIIDIGEAGDIHPKNKFDVGERLALWALANDYGKKDLVVSGPLYKSMKIENGKIRIAFLHVGSGLMAGIKNGLEPTREVPHGKLNRFAIAGEDRKWHWADAIIDGESVVVSSQQVPSPAAVRYAFSMNPEGCNLYNKEGLPASPFRTDNW